MVARDIMLAEYTGGPSAPGPPLHQGLPAAGPRGQAERHPGHLRGHAPPLRPHRQGADEVRLGLQDEPAPAFPGGPGCHPGSPGGRHRGRHRHGPCPPHLGRQGVRTAHRRLRRHRPGDGTAADVGTAGEQGDHQPLPGHRAALLGSCQDLPAGPEGPGQPGRGQSRGLRPGGPWRPRSPSTAPSSRASPSTRPSRAGPCPARCWAPGWKGGGSGVDGFG